MTTPDETPATLAAKTIKALGHPLRVKVLARLCDVEMASPHDLAETFGVPLGTVSYHVRRLHALGFLVLVKQTSRRGAIQHHYALASNVAQRFDGVAEQLVEAERRPAAER